MPILVLHAAALLAVLDLQDRQLPRPARVVAEDQVLGDLLAREAAFWLGTAQADDLARGGRDRFRARRAGSRDGCLFDAADESGAAELLRRVPGLARQPVSGHAAGSPGGYVIFPPSIRRVRLQLYRIAGGPCSRT